mgnify:FL=1|tara:strand:+ start:183 stop:467 length:285 start_codon:yes stop_codon:yes gene_type:complete
MNKTSGAPIIFEDLKNIREAIIRRKAEIESIQDRIEQIASVGGDQSDHPSYDDYHKARMKQKHVKERLVELQVSASEFEVDLLELNYLKGLTNV